MEHWPWILLAALLTGPAVECQLSPVEKTVSGREGETVTLKCQYQTSSSNAYFEWYKQPSDLQAPQFILGKGAGGSSRLENIPDKRFDTRASLTETELIIKSLSLEDSALYYCAYEYYWGSLGGSAIQLIVYPDGEVYEPSYYLLDENDKKVCLATGFSQYDQHKNSTLFSSTTPARISGDSLFSQVAFNASDHNCMAAGGDGGSVSCEDKMKPDPTVNLVSVTVLGLRLIFLKTIVFNVFLTFRLWHSR